jgi:DNA-binding FadR family transcriptional regulator
LDRASFVPLYPRLRERILRGRVGEGATLETERELDASGWR